jgi:acetoin utilization protein AcuC
MGYNPESPTDRAILAAREATFAHHGLDHHFD